MSTALLRDQVKVLLGPVLEYLIAKYQRDPLVANVAIGGIVAAGLLYLGVTVDAGSVASAAAVVVPLVISVLRARAKVTPYVPDEAPGKEGDDSKLGVAK
jgi:hypothetical protein